MKKFGFIKILLVFVLTFMIIMPCVSAEKSKKHKQKKEKEVIQKVYLFYETDKRDLYAPVKEYSLKHKSVIWQDYSELGFFTVLIGGKKNFLEKIFLPHKIKNKNPMIVNMKQFGNDTFIYTRSYDKEFSDNLYYWNLKQKYPKSYEIKDEMLFEDFTKDSAMILKSQIPYMQEEHYSPFIYQINMKRYVGYDEKINKKYAKEEKKKEKEKQKELDKLKKQQNI